MPLSVPHLMILIYDLYIYRHFRYIRIDIGGKCSKKEGGMQLCPRTSDINLCNKVKQKYYFLMSLVGCLLNLICF